MRKSEGFVLALVAAVLALVGILLGVTALGTQGSAVSASGGGSGSGTVIEVTLAEFTILPNHLMAPPGDITFKVTNIGQMEHDFSIGGLGKTSTLKPGETKTLELRNVGVGSYKAICTVAGHESAGMVAELMVEQGAAAGGTSASAASMTSEQMDHMMDAVAKAFPAKTEGVGAQVMEPVIADDGTKVYDLVAKIVDWEVEPGKLVKAWTYNGVVPGPTIKLDVGDRVRINLKNDLPESTSIHFHGIRVPNKMDGVDPYTQKAVKPGQAFTYEFTTVESAVGMYHAHHNAQVQVPNGLFAAFLVGEMPLPDDFKDANVVKDMVMVLNDAGTIGLSLNGKSFPATAPATLRVGESMIVHYMNEGLMAHPMHLHQPLGWIIAKDGQPLKIPFPGDTINIMPGERYTVLYTAEDPGVWAWHCHILTHAEASTGMFGMVTALIVEE